jgi:hypothetical protein
MAEGRRSGRGKVKQHVIASEANQSIRLSKGLLRRKAPRNDGLSEQIFENRHNFSINKIRRCPVFVECSHYWDRIFGRN